MRQLSLIILFIATASTARAQQPIWYVEKQLSMFDF